MNILIADDEQHIREGIANKITWSELQIDKALLAADGKQALEIAQNNKIDILLTDIRMPVVDGIQLSEKILDLYSNCIVIFMSAYSDKEYLMSAIQLGVNNYLEKPIQIAKLREILNEATRKFILREQRNLKNIMVEQNYKISMPLIKNEIALLVTNQNADMNLLIDCIKNEMLGIKINSSYITVILNTCDYFSSLIGKKELNIEKDNLLSSLSDIFACENLRLFWGTRDSIEYVIHVYNKSSDASLGQNVIKSLLEKWLSTQKDKKLFIAIGETVSDFMHIYKSYITAAEAIKQCFFRGYGSIICYEPRFVKINIATEEIVKRFSEAITNGQQKSALDLLTKFTANINQYESTDIDSIKNAYLKFLLILLNTIQNYGISELSIYENDNSLRNKVFTIRTLKELEKFCLQITDIYFDNIKSLQGNKNISLILNYIEKNYSDKNMDINQISQNLYLSPAYLCTYFKRETGKTIKQYINDFRLDKSIDFLLDKNNLVSQVAELVGYDANYFARIFKKKFGISPSEYRERV